MFLLLPMMLWECGKLLRVKHIGVQIAYAGLGALLFFYAVFTVDQWTHFATEESSTLLMTSSLLLIFLVIPVAFVFWIAAKSDYGSLFDESKPEIPKPIQSTLALMWLLLLFGMCYAIFAFLNDYLFTTIFWLLICAWGTDTAAFFLGRKFGKRPLSKRISPNKTLEGTIGGYFVGVILGLVFGFGVVGGLDNWSDVQIVVVSLVLPMTAILGDLLESATKRTVRAKDSGGLLPGHGGLLDRMDSLVLSAGLLLYIHAY